ncbi:energy transducer TonB [uncultured Polaribacter sp.]|uniref:energy transducer TonB n=1 Tax=uncultured Polaribacter sp. TaxID=174711 RepID=UPI00260DD268|nr:energy transducer TonB [uncultured Polaribacter sp.]
MKNLKKLPNKQLEKFSNIFMQLGLVLVLFVVYVTLEHETEQKTVISCNFNDESKIVYIEPTTEILFTKEVKIIPKASIVKDQIFIVDEVVKGNNDIIEKVVDVDPSEIPVIIDINDVVEIKVPDKIVEDVDFISIENAPIFKGCEGLSKKQNKICFDKKMKQFVQRNFDVNLANELGLHSGIHRIYSQFLIDDKGNVVDIKIKSPHKKLDKETQTLIKKLPKFTPGIQGNKPVKVRYALPISFRVE